MACVLLFIIFSYTSATARTSYGGFELLADCAVKNGKVRPSIGTLTSCEMDNEFILGALRGKHIDQPLRNYRFVSGKVEIAATSKADGTRMEAYLHCIGPQGANTIPGMTELYRTIAANTYVTGLILGEEMPVTCHYFACDNVLVLLSYYGLPGYYEDFQPGTVIAEITAGCPCKGKGGSHEPL